MLVIYNRLIYLHIQLHSYIQKRNLNPSMYKLTQIYKIGVNGEGMYEKKRKKNMQKKFFR